MLNATAVGCVGNDSELFYTQNNTPVLNFSIACHVFQDGEQKTQWVQCSLFGTRGESLEDYIKKGCYVAVSGRLTMGGYESKNDGWVSTLNINVQEITLCGKSQPQTTQPTTHPARQPTRQPTTHPASKQTRRPTRQNTNNSQRRANRGKVDSPANTDTYPASWAENNTDFDDTIPF